jgi:hypothetical protein
MSFNTPWALAGTAEKIANIAANIANETNF